MTLLYPWLLLPAAVAFGLFIWLRSSGATDDWAKVVGHRVLAFLRPSGSLSQRNFVVLALALVLAALASPAMRSESADSYALDEGVLVLADVSKSMDLQDISPSRLAAARAAILQISADAGARPVALIAYAGDAFLLQPFATDRRQFDAFAAALEVGLVPQEGSNLERALALTTNIIAESGIGRTRVIIVSDGGGFSGAIPVVAALLARSGHRVDVVMPADPATQEPVAANVSIMGQAARRGGGELVIANGQGLFDLSPLRLGTSLLDQRPVSLLGLRSTDWRNYSHFILLLALPFLLLAFRQVRS